MTAHDERKLTAILRSAKASDRIKDGLVICENCDTPAGTAVLEARKTPPKDGI